MKAPTRETSLRFHTQRIQASKSVLLCLSHSFSNNTSQAPNTCKCNRYKMDR